LARTGIKSFPLHYNFGDKDKKEVMARITDFLN